MTAGCGRSVPRTVMITTSRRPLSKAESDLIVQKPHEDQRRQDQNNERRLLPKLKRSSCNCPWWHPSRTDQHFQVTGSDPIRWLQLEAPCRIPPYQVLPAPAPVDTVEACRASNHDILKMYLAMIRSILEYIMHILCGAVHSQIPERTGWSQSKVLCRCTIQNNGTYSPCAPLASLPSNNDGKSWAKCSLHV